MSSTDFDSQHTQEPHTMSVGCFGPEGVSENSAAGHPKVYLHFGTRAQTQCPYCGRVFVRPAPSLKDS